MLRRIEMPRLVNDQRFVAEFHRDCLGENGLRRIVLQDERNAPAGRLVTSNSGVHFTLGTK